MSHILKQNKKLLKCIRILLTLLILFLFFSGMYFYPGNKIIYFLFSISNIYLLIFAFRKKAIFFETFLSLLFFLGFWFKFTMITSFTDGMFKEGVGAFDYKPESYDFGLIVSIIGIIPLFICGHIREKFFFYPEIIKISKINNNFFQKNRKKILFLITILIFLVAILNVKFLIYQKGLIPQEDYNFLISGIFKWLLLFGLSSIISIILFLEINLFNKIFNFTVVLGILETFLSSVSMISRGMIFNSFSILYGLYKFSKKTKINLSLNKLISYIFLILLLFYSSLILVNHVRASYFYIGKSAIETKKNKINKIEINKNEKKSEINIFKDEFNLIDSNNEIFYLLINRWVGIDAVLAVTQQKNTLNMSLLFEALKEKPNINEPTFYEKEFKLKNFLDNTQYKNVKGNTLTGIVAFLYYSGSPLFLFIGCLILYFIGTILEVISFKVSGSNLIFTSLISQIIAFRYVHFGYLPSQSYLLFGSIAITILAVGLFYQINNKK